MLKIGLNVFVYKRDEMYQKYDDTALFYELFDV